MIASEVPVILEKACQSECASLQLWSKARLSQMQGRLFLGPLPLAPTIPSHPSATIVSITIEVADPLTIRHTSHPVSTPWPQLPITDSA